ncbi:hypothetical protein [Sphingomonas bacterium]|uniref:hypothetical protein n=1 Tax=Sphingomonas bacterium TaxID=1895847 RepID=UPI001575E6A0|nr:hypothetical protein [Sphingomonas bacterium]
MGALFIVSAEDARFAARAVGAARVQFARLGLPDLIEHQCPGWRILHSGYAAGGPDLRISRPNGSAAVAGTMTVGGGMGLAALQDLLARSGPPDFHREELGGQFAAIVQRAGRSFLFGDWFGAFPVYHDAGRRIFSTSLLAALAAMPRAALHRQAVYEFAFNIAPIGNHTVVEQLSLLAPGDVVELLPGGDTVSHHQSREQDASESGAPVGVQIERLRDVLDTTIKAHASAASRGVRCPLSGGIDSRLAFAAARAAGLSPDLYVYGPTGSCDVRIARSIAAGEGLPLDWFDQHDGACDAEAFAATVERNFHQSDGLPNFGNIFDAGGNAVARDARHAGGALAMSGGCGEVMRDFFRLPDQPTSVSRVARTFLSRFSADDASADFDGAAFVSALAGTLGSAIGVDDLHRPMPRLLIEQLYPRVRCRALFGREIGIEARYGPYLMPFLDHRFVAEAVRLPMALRWAGRAEAMLLAAIDPRLAAYPSSYGHHFAGPPSRRHRFDEWASRSRPAWLRERSYRLRRRLGATGDEHGSVPASSHMGRVIDLSFPHMRAFFRPERVRDPALWRRIACLEYFAGWMAAN